MSIGWCARAIAPLSSFEISLSSPISVMNRAHDFSASDIILR